MNCHAFRKVAPATVYDLANATDTLASKEHSAQCDTCRSWFSQLRAKLCKEVIDELADYLEKLLPDADLESINVHLQICPGCREYFESYQTTIRLTEMAHGSDSSSIPPIPEDLVKSILKATKRPLS